MHQPPRGGTKSPQGSKMAKTGAGWWFYVHNHRECQEEYANRIAMLALSADCGLWIGLAAIAG